METLTNIVDKLQGQPIYIQFAACLMFAAIALVAALLPKVILVDIIGLPLPKELSFLGDRKAPNRPTASKGA
jgi:hypothetical protein